MKFVSCVDYQGKEVLINLGRVRKVSMNEETPDVVHTIDGDVLEVAHGWFGESITDI